MESNTKDANHAILYAYLEKIRPPEHIRSQVDIGYSYDGTEVLLYQIRPHWQDASIIRHFPYAKMRFVKSKNIWRLYWLRASGKWEAYTPMFESPNLKVLLDCVDEDKHHCFKG